MRVGQVVVVCCAISVWMWAQRAQACEPIACSVASVFPAGGEIPIDQFRLTFRASEDHRESSGTQSPATPHLFRVDGTAQTELGLHSEPTADDPFAFALTPMAALAPGDHVVFEADQSPCGTDTLSATFTLTPAAPLPTTLGTLNVSLSRARLEVATSAGTCVTTVDAASANFSISLSAAAEPFQDVASYRLILDDQPEFGAADGLPRGEARVYASCDRTPGIVDNVPTGPHRAFLRATLADGTHVDTPEVMFTLDCGEVPAASTSSVDAGTLQRNTSGGCDVAGIRQRAPVWQAGSLPLLALLCARRRRRWRQSRPSLGSESHQA
jgi:hypothetical protein